MMIKNSKAATIEGTYTIIVNNDYFGACTFLLLDSRIRNLIHVMTKITILNGVSVSTSHILIVISLSLDIIGGLAVVTDIVCNGVCLLLVLPNHQQQYNKLCCCCTKCVSHYFEKKLENSSQSVEDT